jgi:uncharacterized phage protein (TIGR02218 family)
MRAVTNAFAARLGANATTLALCWLIERRDGVAFGLTTHDRPIALGGVTYASAPGMEPSAITWGRAGEAHAMEIVGALSEDAVREADLIGGAFDGARVRAFLTDWEMPGAGTIALVQGTIGAISCADGAFTAELRTPMSDLEAVVIERYSPTCRAELGDLRCRVDLARRTRSVTVVGVAGALVTTDDAIVTGSTWQFGRARVLNGAAAGNERAIEVSTGGAITLRAPIAGLAPGARIELVEGCDKRFATCRDRFANQTNFRGEPHVPGKDALARYPGL